ncbi:hypothetical protein BBJ28_00007078 [Nothophytophthora sp. Chile5]|nr:hypothetical protein BBJ28_00007078 [Nothophytophthora sp. Chile5]
MGLAIVAVIQEKTRWVASSLRKLRSKRSRKATEATELQPIALAGASKGFTGSSRQCNTFARTPSGANPESHQHWTDSSGSKAVTGEWEAFVSTKELGVWVAAMAKSANPMEAFRREQKKKELKKHRQERHKEKQGKLAAMDAAELQDQLKNLERQVASNPTDGPTRKRKQELEDTLRAVVKKQKEVGVMQIAEEERRKQAEAPPPAPLVRWPWLPGTMTELAEANKERFQNPENSIYYHPTLNPFGAPPPGKPQMYRGVVPPPGTERVDAEMEEDGVVAPYPTADGETQQYEEQEMDDEAAEEAAESRARLRSLVPVALRVQRRPTVGQKSNVGGPPPAPGPRRPLTVPLAPAPGPAMAAVGPPLGGPPLPPSASTASDSATLTATSDNSVSKEFDAFMEEVKELL